MDHELRALERDAHEKRDAASVLHLVRRLEAVGEHARARGELTSFLDVTEVRREAIRRAPPAHECAIPERVPGVRWTLADGQRTSRGLIQATLGAVVAVREERRRYREIRVLDPLTGSTRFAVPIGEDRPVALVAGDVLLLARQPGSLGRAEIDGYDLATGERIFEVPIAANALALASDGDIIVSTPECIAKLRWPDHSRPPGEPCWTRRPTDEIRHCRDGFVVVREDVYDCVLYEKTGEERFRDHLAFADAFGEVRAHNGFAFRGHFIDSVLDASPRYILDIDRIFDRTNGQVVGFGERRDRDEILATFEMARILLDGFLWGERGRLRSHRIDGSVRWTRELEGGTGVFAVLPGLIYAETGLGLVCLEEPAA